METDKTTEGAVDTTNSEGEGKELETGAVSIPKEEYDKLNQTLGSLKRELKDLKKSKEETKETPEKTQPDDAVMQKLERIALKSEGITHPDDVELARNTAKKWNVDIDEVLADPDFKVKLERLQTERSNVEATSGVRGEGAGQTKAKNTLEYWQSKGQPPTPADVPDRATRQKIVRGMIKSSKGDGKMKFYNS